MSDNDDEIDAPMKKYLEDDEDEVGYGKPPKHTQFKKGQSGNPKGRPPKKYLVEALQDALDQQVTITANGEKQKLMKKEIAVQKLVNDAMQGKSQAVRNLILLMRSFNVMHPM